MTPFVRALTRVVLLAVAVAAGPAMADDAASLVAAERAFAQASAETGLARAYAGTGAGHLAAVPGARTWSPAGGEAAASGDLGYSYGQMEVRADGAGGARLFSYLRFWKRTADGPWRLVLDVLNEIPAPG